jgi:predicted Zn-dependent protease
MLAVTALRDHDARRARELLAQLAREYPHNPLYAQEIARLDLADPPRRSQINSPAGAGAVQARSVSTK